MNERELPGTGRGRIDKRSAILDAAVKVFTREGYAQAGIDAIAAAAGVAKPTLYNHFGDKENLFRVVMRDGAERTANRIVAALASLPDDGQDLAAELERVAHRVVECQLSDEGWALQRLLYAEASRLPDLYDQVVARGSQPVQDVLAGRLSSLANRGHLDLDDPAVAAAQFIALVSGNLPGLSALGTRPVAPADLATAVRTGVDTFLRAFGTPRRRPARRP
ncbi:TetR/AcrR family transcriptional regulator C-terminal domain-containing protein [Kitasatospora sp. NPDC028055]|uniref:TetR/AcrR family transcriptional regulator C-terminal domain-containing protein n=1 Tax=Kitasatospora sp. NPDC028055 TaxID=3155653 RepID=UPI0033E0FACF